MNRSRHQQPMIAQFSAIKSDREMGYALADFLDRFNSAPDASLIADEPAPLQSALGDQGLADAYLAATAAWLAHRYRFPVPAWARGNLRALQTPWFASSHPNQKALFLQESPAEFRVRNLFVSANALNRA